MSWCVPSKERTQRSRSAVSSLSDQNDATTAQHLKDLQFKLCFQVVWWIPLGCVHTGPLPRYLPHASPGHELSRGWTIQRDTAMVGAKMTDADPNGTPDLGWSSKNPLEPTCPGNWTENFHQLYPSAYSERQDPTHARLHHKQEDCLENHQKAKLSFRVDGSTGRDVHSRSNQIGQGLKNNQGEATLRAKRDMEITGSTEVFKPWVGPVAASELREALKT